MRKWSIIILLAIVCTACTTGGNGGARTSPKEQQASAGQEKGGKERGTVTVYTARHYEADSLLFDAFTKRTGIKVNEIKGTAEELVKRIKQEGEQTGADLFFTADGGVLDDAKRQEVLEPLRSEVIDRQVPAKWRDPDDCWIGIATRARVIVYAKDRLKLEQLSTYEALTDAKWKGKVLIRSSTNLYNQSLLASFIAIHGEAEAEKWAKGMVSNFARKPEGGDREQAKAIAYGFGDVAVMNTYYIGQLANSADPEEVRIAQGLGVFFPNQETTGTHVNISGIGLVRYSDNRDNALKLVEFMTSKEGQELLVQSSYEYPVNEEADVPEPIKSFGNFKAQQLDFADLARYRSKAIEIFRQSGWS